MDPVEMWPTFGLRVRTPRLTLRPVDPEIMYDVINLGAAGIHDPRDMPFSEPWTDLPHPDLQRGGLRFYFRVWAGFQPDDWRLPFAVYENGTLVGVQDVVAHQFPVLREFATGSWLGRDFQGKGIGREMRAAALHFGFAGLGAARALTEAFSDNSASLAVTRRLGYVPNGSRRMVRRGEPAQFELFCMDRAHWETIRRDDIEIDGLDDAVLEFLGISAN